MTSSRLPGPAGRLHRAVFERAHYRLGFNDLFVLSRQADPAGEPAMPKGCEISFLEREALDLFARDRSLGMDAGWIARACDRGDACVGVVEKGELLGYVWIATRPTPHLDGVWVDFPAHAVWRYKAYVRPEQRGRRLGSALYSFGEERYSERGRPESLMSIASYNAPSLVAARRAGARVVGRLTYLRARGLFLAWHSPGTRRHGLRFYVPG